MVSSTSGWRNRQKKRSVSLKFLAPFTLRLDVGLVVALVPAQAVAVLASQARVSVVPRVLRLRHVLQQVDNVAERPEGGRPVGQPERLAIWNRRGRGKGDIDERLAAAGAAGRCFSVSARHIASRAMTALKPLDVP